MSDQPKCPNPSCDNKVQHEGETCNMDCYRNWFTHWHNTNDLTILTEDAIVPLQLQDQPWYEAELRRT